MHRGAFYRADGWILADRRYLLRRERQHFCVSAECALRGRGSLSRRVRSHRGGRSEQSQLAEMSEVSGAHCERTSQERGGASVLLHSTYREVPERQGETAHWL